jgi:hypothetical protein
MVSGTPPGLMGESQGGTTITLANLERWFTLPESSVGRERLVRLSHNTADGDLNVTSLPSTGSRLLDYVGVISRIRSRK